MGAIPALIRHHVTAEIARVRATAARLAGKAAGFAIAAVFAVIGLQALAVAGYFALSEAFKPWLAALLTAVGALVIAGLVVLIAGMRGRRRAARVAAPPSTAQMVADALRSGVERGAKAGDPPAALGVEAALGALIVGVALGSSPGLRGALGRALLGAVKPPPAGGR